MCVCVSQNTVCVCVCVAQNTIHGSNNPSGRGWGHTAVIIQVAVGGEVKPQVVIQEAAGSGPL